MKKSTIIFAALAICFALTTNNFAQKVSSVYLKVAIDDSVSQVNGIRSDGNGSYINGQSAVSAVFGQYGYFTLNSGNRVINAIYSLPIDGSTSLSSDSKTGVVITTFADSTYLQNMPIGSIQCKGLAVNINLGDAAATKRTIGYRAGRGDLTITGYIKVTHPDSNTWIMESNSQGTCSGFDDVARVRDAKTKGKTVPDTDYGRYFMPLRLILTRQ